MSYYGPYNTLNFCDQANTNAEDVDSRLDILRELGINIPPNTGNPFNVQNRVVNSPPQNISIIPLSTIESCSTSTAPTFISGSGNYNQTISFCNINMPGTQQVVHFLQPQQPAGMVLQTGDIPQFAAVNFVARDPTTAVIQQPAEINFVNPGFQQCIVAQPPEMKIPEAARVQQKPTEVKSAKPPEQRLILPAQPHPQPQFTLVNLIQNSDVVGKPQAILQPVQVNLHRQGLAPSIKPQILQQQPHVPISLAQKPAVSSQKCVQHVTSTTNQEQKMQIPSAQKISVQPQRMPCANVAKKADIPPQSLLQMHLSQPKPKPGIIDKPCQPKPALAQVSLAHKPVAEPPSQLPKVVVSNQEQKTTVLQPLNQQQREVNLIKVQDTGTQQPVKAQLHTDDSHSSQPEVESHCKKPSSPESKPQPELLAFIKQEPNPDAPIESSDHKPFANQIQVKEEKDSKPHVKVEPAELVVLQKIFEKSEHDDLAALSKEDFLEIQNMADNVRNILIMNKDFDQLTDKLDKRLSESGWKFKILNKLKKAAYKKRRDLKFNDLYALVKDVSANHIPEEVYNEMLASIKDSVENVYKNHE